MDIFKENNIKKTNQRESIYNIISSSDKEVTNKLIENLTDMDKSTIYRIIDLFIEKNMIEKNLNNNGDIFYTIKNKEHEHYINCIKCKKIVKIDCHIDENEITEKGFTLLSHKIQLDGICDKCKK